MVDGVAPLDLNQTPPPDSPSATDAEMVDGVDSPSATDAEMVDGVDSPSAADAEMVGGVASSDSNQNQIPPPDPHSPLAVAVEMADGVASIDLNEIRPPDHPSSSSYGPHLPLINYRCPTVAEHWSREEHIKFLLGMELYGVGKWKEICEYGGIAKTPAQLASYAQEASALFVGVYEPVKQTLSRIFPENLSALAHFVRHFLLKMFTHWRFKFNQTIGSPSKQGVKE
ncbi:hypothetical protein K1719_004499 [Acacia pycnantha]|nr:hypothetical protein K1719_004499 [Acacia pycnantha]